MRLLKTALQKKKKKKKNCLDCDAVVGVVVVETRVIYHVRPTLALEAPRRATNVQRRNYVTSRSNKVISKEVNGMNEFIIVNLPVQLKVIFHLVPALINKNKTINMYIRRKKL